VGKRLNNFLRDCGITDPRKTVHSLRHRAIDVLRGRCDPDLTKALTGHGSKSVHDRYGSGDPNAFAVEDGR